MTVPPKEEHIHDAAPTAAPPKKRRRRTGAGGAQDDCFTCQKRSVGCDRKRPYCTPCIEIGKDCSGYKTTLTWGVGVASRGKLRGLSSPVASRKPDGSDSAANRGVAKRRKSSILGAVVESCQTPTQTTVNHTSPTDQSPPKSEAPYPSLSIPIPAPQLQGGWNIPGFLNHRLLASNQIPPGQLHTAITPHFEHDGYPMSAMSMSSYTDEWNSPPEYPQTPASTIFTEQQHAIESYMDPSSYNSTTESYPHSLSSSIDSLQSIGSARHFGSVEPADIQSFSNALFSEDFLDAELQQQEESSRNDEVSLINSNFDHPFFFVSPRLQSLISYYDQHICPFLVRKESL